MPKKSKVELLKEQLAVAEEEAKREEELKKIQSTPPQPPPTPQMMEADPFQLFDQKINYMMGRQTLMIITGMINVAVVVAVVVILLIR